MLLYGSGFDGAVGGVDFPLFSKKPCQVNFLKMYAQFDNVRLSNLKMSGFHSWILIFVTLIA